MTPKKIVLAVALATLSFAAHAQYATPHVTTTAGADTVTLGSTVFVNHGLVGVGRIPAGTIDAFGESFGSVSGLQITGWTRTGPSAYAGTFNILPDRGYNSGAFYADYAARIQQVPFTFTPYTGTANIGGSTVPTQIAAQTQIAFPASTCGTSPCVSGVRFTYVDPLSGATSFTTGLDPDVGSVTLFGKKLPYVRGYTGLQSPSSASPSTYTINKLPIDAEALAFQADGSGYVGDEYGPYVYHFDASKRIVGAIVPPAAWVPRSANVSPDFGANSTVVNGRRVNQGMEGVALSPDGKRLFALLQSATMQDSDSSAQNRRQTRLLVYDISADPTPAAPIAEYALTLPTYRTTGNGSAVNATAAQSEIVALDNDRLLVLSRDANGQGAIATNPSVVKVVLLVDLRVGSPTNVAGTASDADLGKITSAPGTLAANVTPLARVEAINMLNSAQLAKFNIALDSGTGQVSQLTLGEKWEGLALVPANDPAAPGDYFLFVANDNDFLTSTGRMRGPDGTIVSYDGFAGYPATRLPGNAPTGGSNNNDTMFLAYRVTLTATPDVVRGGFVYDRRAARFRQQVSLVNQGQRAIAGPVYLALDRLSGNATVIGNDGVTAAQAPTGSPYVTVVPAGQSLPAGASTSVTLQFANPTAAAIDYAPRVLVLGGSATP